LQVGDRSAPTTISYGEIRRCSGAGQPMALANRARRRGPLGKYAERHERLDRPPSLSSSRLEKCAERRKSGPKNAGPLP
jgi:hypothetical protein